MLKCHKLRRKSFFCCAIRYTFCGRFARLPILFSTGIKVLVLNWNIHKHFLSCVHALESKPHTAGETFWRCPSLRGHVMRLYYMKDTNSI